MRRLFHRALPALAVGLVLTAGCSNADSTQIKPGDPAPPSIPPAKSATGMKGYGGKVGGAPLPGGRRN
jgi:hypothetical protein